MNGKEDIRAGDELLCILNEGLMTAGGKHVVKGITDRSINVNGCQTAWESRKDFRWGNYKHIPKPGREEFRKELEDLKRYERERNFHDYSDIIEKAERELAGRKCPRCNGRGWMPAEHPMTDSSYDCRICDGTGED
jgi:hypothetical protein